MSKDEKKSPSGFATYEEQMMAEVDVLGAKRKRPDRTWGGVNIAEFGEDAGDLASQLRALRQFESQRKRPRRQPAVRSRETKKVPLRPRPVGLEDDTGRLFLAAALQSMLPNTGRNAGLNRLTVPFTYAWTPIIKLFDGRPGCAVTHTQRTTKIRVACPRALCAALGVEERFLSRGGRFPLPPALPQNHLLLQVDERHPVTLRFAQKQRPGWFPRGFWASSDSACYPCACGKCPAAVRGGSTQSKEAVQEELDSEMDWNGVRHALSSLSSMGPRRTPPSGGRCGSKRRRMWSKAGVERPPLHWLRLLHRHVWL
jgi:hypothetical protein